MKRQACFIVAVLNFCLLFTASSQAQEVISAGDGKYVKGLTGNKQGPSNRVGAPVQPRVTSNLSAPHPTNDWWSSAIWQYHPENQFGENLFAHPLAFHANAGGLGVSYPNAVQVNTPVRLPKGHEIQDYRYLYQEDFTAGLVGLAATQTLVDDYGDFTVSLVWQSGNRKLRATIGHGLPFAYFTTEGAPAMVTFNRPVTVWKNNGHHLGVTVEGRHYGIFGPTNSTWTISGNTVVNSVTGNSYYSVAALPDSRSETLAYFQRRAHAHVVDSEVTWSYDQANATSNATYRTTVEQKETGGVDRPLLALYRHQWLNSPTALTDYQFVSPRGVMKVRDGRDFRTEMKFHGVMPTLPYAVEEWVDGFSESQLYQYLQDIYATDYNTRWNNSFGMDTYWSGKAMCRLAHLIPIADAVGHHSARDLFLQEVKLRLEDWFDAQEPHAFFYDETWGTLIGFRAGFGSDTQLNDHHFHYGYFIMAAAIVAQYDADWAERYGPMVNLLARDANSHDRDDELFPFLRNFDLYAGHGWASGSALFAAGNNQESSSESLNFSTALILWGGVTGNQEMRDLGIYLYTTEVEAVRQYWFDVDEEVFPDGFQSPTVGMVWGDGVHYAIWWDGYVEEVHGINFLPIQPGMLFLGHKPENLRKNQDFMRSNGGGNNVWTGIHASVRSLYDSDAAIAEFNAGYQPEWGETKAHSYHWIHAMNQLGRVDPRVTANTAHYGVFHDGENRTYAAFNPADEDITVTFSDGFSLDVVANSMAWGDQEGTDGLPTGGVSGGNTGSGNDGGGNNGSGDGGNTGGGSDDSGSSGGSDGGSNSDGSSGGGSDDGDTPTPGFSYTTTQNNGQVSFQATTEAPSLFVDVHYRVNQGPQLNYRMQGGPSDWNWTIPQNLQSGDQVDYYFTYEQNGAATDTEWKQVTVDGSGSSGGGSDDDGNTGDGSDNGEGSDDGSSGNDDSGASNPDYTQDAIVVGGKVTIRFQPTWTSRYVDVHYTMQGSPQLNYRMVQNNGAWYHISHVVLTGPTLTYWLTYERDGRQYDSPKYTVELDDGSTGGSGGSGGDGGQDNGYQGNSGGSTVTVPDFSLTNVNDGVRLLAQLPGVSQFVDVHYRINGGPQLNYRMNTSDQKAWDFTIPAQSGDRVEYWFTYELNGLATDTARQTVTR